MNAKERYDKKVKTTRVFLADYLALKRISQVAGVSMAEALHELIIRQEHKPEPELEQMPMIPVTVARSAPVATARRRSTPVTTNFSREVENVTNGHRQAD
ncbi:hypothetical protein ES705_45300 [subsurface metagenome]